MQEFLQEIMRVGRVWFFLAAIAVASVVVSTGVLALPLAPASAASSTATGSNTAIGVIRLGGADRYETAELVAQQGWASGANTVFLAYGSNFPDALAGVPLAAANNAPILLTDTTTIPTATSTEIKALGAKNAVLLGGSGVISDTVQKSLQSQGLSVSRVSGADRYATAVAVGQSLEKKTPSKTAVLATGGGFADALSIAPVAGINGWPVVFTGVNSLPTATSQFIKAQGITAIVIVGGTGVVSTAVQKQLAGLGVSNVTRVAGSDRYGTSAAIAQKYASLFSAAVSVATGTNFVDALTGGVLSALLKMPLLLLNPAAGTSQNTSGLLSGSVYVYGGTGALPDKVAGTVWNGTGGSSGGNGSGSNGSGSSGSGSGSGSGGGGSSGGSGSTAFTSAPIPTITGGTTVGSTLTVNAGTWSPTASLSYQWLRDGQTISGATSGTYMLTSDDEGHAISVSVTGTASGFTTTTKTSSATTAIQAASPGVFTTTPTPTISGTASVGSTLTVDAGTWVPEATLSYQWLRDGQAIEGATSNSYTLTSDDQGHTISVEVTGAASGYPSESVTSSATVAVQPASSQSFTSTPIPTISGSATVGSTLTVDAGAWDSAASLSYQWLRDGQPIDRATSSSYTLTSDDQGHTISVAVTGSASGYTAASTTSAATAAVQASSSSQSFTTTPTPTITGTATVGSTLTADAGTWVPAATLSYQWLRDGQVISGASGSTYTLTSDDQGHTISVSVTGSASGYTTATVTSGQTATVQAASPGAFTTTPIPTISGSANVGSVLTANAGTWVPAATFAYQWSRDSQAIDGATSSTYTLTSDDEGHAISVAVTGSATGYTSATVTSAATGQVQAAPSVTNVDEGLTSSQTWDGGVYEICGTISIPSGVKLTITPGTIVKACPNASIAVSGGSLVASGTAASPVVFTSLLDDSVGGDTNGDGSASTPKAGDWQGISYSNGSSAALDYVDISYAQTGVTINGSGGSTNVGALSLTNGSVQYSAEAAVSVNSVDSVTVTGDTFVGNLGSNNFYMATGLVYIDGANQVSVANNTFTDNYPGVTDIGMDISVWGSNVDLTNMGGNVSNGGAAEKTIWLGVDTLSASATWSPAEFALVLDGTVTVGSGVTLTLLPGTVVKAFTYRDYSDYGYTPSVAELSVSGGSLVASGTAASPVVFTSLLDDSVGGDTNGDGSASTPKAGDWQGIAVSTGGSVSIASDEVEYADSGITGLGAGAFSVEDTGIKFGNSGISVSEQTATPIIEGNIISGTDYLVNIDTSNIDLSQLGGNTGQGTADNVINLSGDVLVADAALPISGNLTPILEGCGASSCNSLTVATGVSLILGPGTVIKGESGGNIQVNGTLESEGTSDSPVILTSWLDQSVGGTTNSGYSGSPSAGDWGGIIFANVNNDSYFINTVIEYASTAITINYLSGMVVNNTEFSYNSAAFSVAGTPNDIPGLGSLDCLPPYTSSVVGYGDWYGTAGGPGSSMDLNPYSGFIDLTGGATDLYGANAQMYDLDEGLGDNTIPWALWSCTIPVPPYEITYFPVTPVQTLPALSPPFPAFAEVTSDAAQ